MSALVVLLSAIRLMAQSPSNELKPCDQILTTFFPGWDSKVPAHKQARVEIRNCGTAEKIELQMVAWAAYAGEPALVRRIGPQKIVWSKVPHLPWGPRLPTQERVGSHDRIVRVVVAGNVFLLETAGEGPNQVAVLLFERGSVWFESQKQTNRHLPVELSGNTLTLTSWSDDGTEWRATYSTGLK